MVHLLKKNIEIGLLVSVMWTVWEDTDVCAKQYRCALGIVLMTVLLYLYGIIIYCTINAPGHRNNVVYGLKDTDKQY